MADHHYWVYILSCENGNYYTGYTNDLEKRYNEHVAGTAKCKYTRSFKPLGIAQSWKINDNKAMAMKIERHIKKMTKQQKELLIATPLILTQLFEIAQPFKISL